MADQDQLPFGRRLMQLLLEDGGYTQPNGNVNWAKFGQELPDLSYETLRKAVGGLRQPTVWVMETVADHLGVSPTVFVEYRLAQAREAFDPEMNGGGEEGLKVAAGNLEVWERARGRAKSAK